MPTMKPRIAVTLSQPIYETISRLAELQGASRSSVVADLLAAAHPPLMRTVALLEAALEAPKQVQAGLRQTLEALERDLGGKYTDSLLQMDWVIQEFLPTPGGDPACGEAPGVGRYGSNPRIVTRGSGTKNQRLTKGSKQVRKQVRKGGKHGSF